MNEVAVSIVIPIYNADRYLEQCLESICTQSLEEWEVICVDDHSTDHSMEILHGYEEKDDRIHVYNNEGMDGAGGARNFGLQYALGDYLLFLDADDFFDRDLLLNVYRQCVMYDLDICIYDYAEFDDKMQKVTWRFDISEVWGKKYKNRCFSMQDEGDEIFLPWSCAPWTRMVRKKLVMETGIRFQEIHNANDVFFAYALLANADRVKYVTFEKPLIYYRVNVADQLTNSRDRNPYCIYYALEQVYDYYLQYFSQYMKSGFFTCFVQHIRNSILSVSADVRRKLVTFYQDKALSRIGIEDAISKRYINGSYKAYMENLSAADNDQWVMMQGGNENDMFANPDKTKLLKEYLQREGYTCVLWGMGKLGKIYLKECKKAKIPITFAVDMDKSKVGTIFEGCMIKNIECCKDNVDIVFVTNVKWLEQVEEKLSELQSNVKVIDLYSFYRMGLDLDQCIR